MKKYNYVYITTNLINEKQYVGSHETDNLNDNYLGSGTLFRRAIQKYGKEKFKRKILKKYKIIEKARLAEKVFIKKFNTIHPYGYNISPTGGNDRGIKGCMSEETKEKLRGKNNGMYGKKLSEEAIERIRVKNTGRKFPPRTKEHIERLKNSLKGHKSWNKGKTGVFSKEALEKMSQAASLRIAEKNTMYGKTLYNIWMKKYGEEEANIRLQNMKDKMSTTRKDKTFTDKHCKNISDARMGLIYEKIKCPHCGKEIDPGNYGRWHGDKCKIFVNI